MPEQPDRPYSSITVRAIVLLIVAAFIGLLYIFVWPSGPRAQAQSTTTTPSAQTKPTPRPTPRKPAVGRNCETCHRAIVESFTLEVHGKSAKFMDDSRAPKCEACHDNSLEHAEKSTLQTSGAPVGNPAKMKSAPANESCLQCHSRDRYLFNWSGGKHDRQDMSCMSCHSSHHIKFTAEVAASRKRAQMDGQTANSVEGEVPRAMLSSLTVEETCFRCHAEKRKAMFQRSTHLFRTENREMKVNCTSCHNPHGGEGPKMFVGRSLNDTCYQCHAEKRGPFLWEHTPVQENCMTCHTAHGSNQPSLLVTRSHQLCQQCHINILARHQTVAGFDVFTFNRGCVNCHTQIHGSNHPAGKSFAR